MPATPGAGNPRRGLPGMRHRSLWAIVPPERDCHIAHMKTARPGYGRYVLAMLLAAYVLNSFDRSVLNLLLEPIRHELGASDTQLGLLSGLAFGLFYSGLA